MKKLDDNLLTLEHFLQMATLFITELRVALSEGDALKVTVSKAPGAWTFDSFRLFFTQSEPNTAKFYSDCLSKVKAEVDHQSRVVWLTPPDPITKTGLESIRMPLQKAVQKFTGQKYRVKFLE